MRSNLKRSNKGTSSADLAGAPDLAYVASGEGKWSRTKAHPQTQRDTRSPPQRTTRELIAYHERKLATLRAQHRTERDPVRLLRNERDQDAKSNFIAALWRTLAQELRK
jgi:hypothetical protein